MFNIQQEENEEVVIEANTQVQQTSAQQVNQSTGVYLDFPKVLQTISPLAKNNKDIVNFAYYLYRTDLVHPYEHNEEAWEAIKARVNFCDCARKKSDSKLMNFSRLEQLYTCDLFSNHYTIYWNKKENLAQSMQDGCRFCKAAGDCQHALCPYWLCHVIKKAAEIYKVDPEVIFNDLLGDEKLAFAGRDAEKLTVQIPSELLTGIDAKSAYGAYMLLISDLVRPGEQNGFTLAYTHIPLCRGDDKSNKTVTMMDFWKTGSGCYDTIEVNDLSSIINKKTEGCRKCGFAQCPHRLAAYFINLSRRFNVPVTDLAYFVASNTTYANISNDQNFQFNKYLAAIRQMPLTEASREEILKIIYYIVGRNKNSNIPFLPFNTAIISPDRENAYDLANILSNAEWYFDYFWCGRDNTFEREVYMAATSATQLIEIYEGATKGTTMIVYDVRLLCDNKDFRTIYHKLLKLMQDRKRDITTILIGEKDEIAGFFKEYPEIKTKIFTKVLELQDMDSASVYEEVVDKLAETFTIPEEVEKRLEQYVQLAYPASALQNKEFVNDLHEKILFNHYNHDVQADSIMTVKDIPYITPPRTEAEIFEEINRLTGLENVKKELKIVNDLVKFNIKMGSANKNAVNLHMVFNGNPGTGKTTVARLTAEILHSIGFIQENKLVVCSAKDLIGQYMGQTAPLTAKKCQEAYNGVLFIDEAYQLNPYTSDKADIYKEECIAELIQQMENNRDRLVVIFAGYTEEMNDFLNRANTGLRSRIGKIIEFPDYSVEELVDIFTKIVERSGMQLGVGAANKAAYIFERAKTDAKRFGNARFARNLYECSLMQHAAITSNMDKEDPALHVLQSDEITCPTS